MKNKIIAKEYTPEVITSQGRKTMFIEASAGTGKTYTITGIVAHLVSQEKIPIEKILIVTYTEKAVGELKDRIRQRLSTLEGCDADVNNAPIYTIHSFCQKTLEEFSFTAGQPSSMALISEDEIDSFIDRWIRDDLKNDEEFKKLFLEVQNKEKLISDIKKNFKPAIEKYYLSQNGLEDKEIISLDKNIISPEKVEDLFEYPDFQENWDKLNANRNAKKAEELIASIKENIEVNHRFSFDGSRIKANYVGPEIKESFEFFKNLKSSIGKIGTDELFYLNKLKDLYKKWQQEKVENKFQTYNDMIRNVREAVCNPSSKLTQKLKEKYTFAIIDEFQDTNKKQWDIFKKVFLYDDKGNKDSKHNIIVVGDPKQSIFSFQGADVNVYENAIAEIYEKEADSAYSLMTNWRSTDSMVNACNKLFTPKKEDEKTNSFFDDEALFSDSKVSGKKENARFMNKETPPFWIYGSEDSKDKGVSEYDFAKAAVKTIVDCCTYIEGSEQTALQVFKKGRMSNVTFSDFAVLARSGSEMEPIEAEMRKAGIPYSRYKDRGLFSSFECAHWIAMLNAIAADNFTGSHRKILSEVLFTKFFGVAFEKLNDEKYDSPLCPERQKIISWQLLAQKKQWAKLLEKILKDTRLEDRLSQLDSMASLSKFQQIGNYIVDYLYKKDCSLEEVSKKLLRLSANSEESDDEEKTIAKATDFDCVQVMTMHSSKGLEFPVVIAAGGFKGKNTSKASVYSFHLGKNAKLGFDCLAQTFSDKEEVQERQRLFYVAYTRASSLMILPFYSAWSQDKKQEMYSFLKNKLSSFMKDAENKPLWKKIDFNADTTKESDSILKLQVQNILNHNLDKTKAESQTKKEALQSVQKLADKIPSLLIRKHSYSSLSHGAELGLISEKAGRIDKEEEIENIFLASFDDSENPVICSYSPKAKTVIYSKSYPKGTRLGIAVHEVFERTDFQVTGNLATEEAAQKDQTVSKLIENCFKKQTLLIDEEDSSLWKAQTASYLWNTLNASFPEVLGNMQTGRTFALKELGLQDRLAEVEFNMNPAEKEAFRNYCNGFIDLIFKREINGNPVYAILDWKSNIFENPEDYSNHQKLKKVTDELYSIQRVLYSYSLIRWLKQFYPKKSEDEIFNSHFGGIYYVYIRGCVKDTSNGIYARTWNNWEELENQFKNIYKKLIKMEK
ncbi:MAG: UvrD-helicase domain-containing protein [Treponema sp.]|nr:UvrD-helicase domain-containing protein [Treponema sp.]